MTTTAIKLIDWTHYIKRKTEEGEDPDVFRAEHPWELNYLLHQVKTIYSQYTDTSVFLSIRAAMKILRAPYSRSAFAETVINDLLKRKPFAEN